MSRNSSIPVDLGRLARKAMLEGGFAPDLPPDAAKEAAQLKAGDGASKSGSPLPGLRDLRSLLWSSIDNPESQDLDQVEYAERAATGEIRLRIGIADVDACVPKDSALDRHARENTTSVYTGVAVFPMLPVTISEGVTSLLESQDRTAVIIELDVSEDGSIRGNDVYPALIRNHAKLVYERVGEWLEQGGPSPEEIGRVAGLEDQLRLQDEAAERLHAERLRQGALDFETIEARPVMEHGRIVDLAVPHKNRARLLIENLMIAANTAMATLLQAKGRPAIRRVVREPERWPRIVEVAGRTGDRLPDQPDAQALAHFLARRKAVDPMGFPDLSLSIVKLLGPGEYAVVTPNQEGGGHFGLAVQHYTHSTAPNRRYPDLVTQRLLKAVQAGAPSPYTVEELGELAGHCTERESAARKVERRMRKAAAAVLLSDRVGEVFEAVVTGASPKGTYVRVLAPPVEGRVMRGERGLDVGDRVRVRLLDTDPERGFIDFARA
jgi:exoribonuclease-2